MKVLRYLQVNFHLQKKRSIILTILVAIVGIMIGVEPVIMGIYQSQAQPNWWDVIFASLGNKFFVLAIFGGVFSYLISDSVIENAFGCSLLTRINNRTRWWYSKCFFTAAMAFAYTALIAVAIMLGAISWGVSSEWSPLAQQFSEALYISPFMLTVSPMTSLLTAIFYMLIGVYSTYSSRN